MEPVLAKERKKEEGSAQRGDRRPARSRASHRCNELDDRTELDNEPRGIFSSSVLSENERGCDFSEERSLDNERNPSTRYAALSHCITFMDNIYMNTRQLRRWIHEVKSEGD